MHRPLLTSCYAHAANRLGPGVSTAGRARATILAECLFTLKDKGLYRAQRKMVALHREIPFSETDDFLQQRWPGM
jgi:hypothetical protein